ncbi:MAG: hypothetical protein L3J12_00715 [Spirochaetales bacterium]|nr:hypothetical protein [Spirochaetales bacterium]
MTQQNLSVYRQIIKRNGKSVPFDTLKITRAIASAGEATRELGFDQADRLTLRVINLAHQVLGEKIPTVEEIQDIVEEVLIQSVYHRTAKAYIIYRDQHKKIREIASHKYRSY